MRVLLGLCLLAASMLAVANAVPSVGGAARLQRKELMKRLQTKLEAFKKKSDEDVDAPSATEDDRPTEYEPTFDPTYAAALTYIMDLNEKIINLEYAISELWQSYGLATDYEKKARRRRRSAGDENGPQQVILRREILNILNVMEYDLVALELLPIDFTSPVEVPTEPPTEPTPPSPTEAEQSTTLPPTEPTTPSEPLTNDDDDEPQSDDENSEELGAAAERVQNPAPLRSPVFKKTRVGSKPVQERAAALKKQLERYLSRRAK